jgi:hypothetical protein
MCVCVPVKVRKPKTEKKVQMICEDAKECRNIGCPHKKYHEKDSTCDILCTSFYMECGSKCITKEEFLKRKTKKEQKNMNRDSSGRFISKKTTPKTNSNIPTPEEFNSQEIPCLKTLFKNNPDMLTMINAAVSFIPGFKKSAEDMEISSLKYMMENMPELYAANREIVLALYNKLGFANAAKIVMDDILK